MSREYPCIYFEDGKCKKFSEPGVQSWCVQGPCADQTMSRADLIRNMGDREMAVWLPIIFERIFEDGIPGEDWMLTWLQNAEEALQSGEEQP